MCLQLRGHESGTSENTDNSPGEWNDEPCAEKLPGCVCQPPPPAPSPIRPPAAPPNDYTLRCTDLEDDGTTRKSTFDWEDAKADCELVGLQLASIHSAEEEALVFTLADNSPVWIGGKAKSVGTPTNPPM